MAPRRFTRSFNLQDMCLIAIVRDIDLFVHNKTIPQKHIDFLFRAYSDEILSKHKDLKKYMDEDVMMWFLNPHVKKISVLPSIFMPGRILQKLKRIGFGITSLNLSSSWFPLNSTVCCLPHVVHLNLASTSCSDETLACIQASCPHLETLNVHFCMGVTDHGMENLCRGKLVLKNLGVQLTKVTYHGIVTVLERIPSLEYIDSSKLIVAMHQIAKKLSLIEYDNVEYDKEMLESLVLETNSNKQYNLRELKYNNPILRERIHDLKIIQAFVKLCPKLKKLHFSNFVNEQVLNTCAYFQNLEQLKIKMSHKKHVRMYDALTPILPISKNLKTLILSCARISFVNLVACFNSLERLYLKRVSFTPFKKGDVKISQTNLLTLVMKDVHMVGSTYEGVSSLISLSKNVTKLYLKCFKHLPSEILDVILESMKNLTLVNIDRTEVDMQYVNPLFEIPSMLTVVVNGNISTIDIFGKSDSCTLFWRNSCDFDINDNKDNYRIKYNHDIYENDESDIISDECSSDVEDYDDYGSFDVEDYDYFDYYGSGDSDYMYDSDFF